MIAGNVFAPAPRAEDLRSDKTERSLYGLVLGYAAHRTSLLGAFQAETNADVDAKPCPGQQYNTFGVYSAGVSVRIFFLSTVCRRKGRGIHVPPESRASGKSGTVDINSDINHIRRFSKLFWRGLPLPYLYARARKNKNRKRTMASSSTSLLRSFGPRNTGSRRFLSRGVASTAPRPPRSCRKIVVTKNFRDTTKPGAAPFAGLFLHGRSRSDLHQFPPLTTSSSQRGAFSTTADEGAEAVISREGLIRRSRKEFAEEYEISKKLGEGGFGEVYLVKHKITGQFRAAKKLRGLNIDLPAAGADDAPPGGGGAAGVGDSGLLRRSASQSSGGTSSLETEIGSLMELDHPQICKLFEYFVEEQPGTGLSDVTLIMELFEGNDMFDRLIEVISAGAGDGTSAPGVFPELEASVLMRQMLRAVLGCHSVGIIHRDIKPENFMFTAKDNDPSSLKLIDLGLAQRLKKPDDVVEGEVKGTLA